jgi:hypothetical protein
MESRMITRSIQILTLVAVAFAAAPITPTFALETGDKVSTCQRHPKCTANQNDNGSWTIVTGSGGVSWCPPEEHGKCIVVKPGGRT